MVKPNWDTEELIEHWTLLPQELELVENKVGGNKIGFALLLKHFQIFASFPNHCSSIRGSVISYIAFYFGFTIFPPDNEPYNFSCILLSPDLTKLSNVTGEMIQEIASSPNSKQQFRFPTRRAAGITTLPMWLDAGDPPGEYGIEIYLNDELVYSVDFTVYEPES